MLRIINWNISYQGITEKKIDLLQQVISQAHYPCLVSMQEVTPTAYEAICKSDFLDSHSFSLNIRPRGKFEGRNRSLGCFVGTTSDIEMINSSLIERAPFPERALTTHLKCGQFEFKTVCFHSLTGIDYKKAKSAQFAALADYLNSTRGEPMVLCCDLNEPKMDYLDSRKIEFFDQKGDKGKCAGYILKPGSTHDLRDIYRIHLMQTKPEIFDGIMESKVLIPDNFAASHIFSSGLKKRYDYIMASEHFGVKDARYLYNEAIQHGSDHAMVVGDMAFLK